MEDKKIILSKNMIIRKLYYLIEVCKDWHTLDVIVSLIDYVANTREEIPLKSAEAFLKEREGK